MRGLMKLKQQVMENIKQMDISLGGGIFGEKARVDTINHPVLVIGLGGTGTDALLRLKYQVSRRFKLPDNAATKQKKQKPDNIEFLALETSEHEQVFCGYAVCRKGVAHIIGYKFLHKKILLVAYNKQSAYYTLPKGFFNGKVVLYGKTILRASIK